MSNLCSKEDCNINAYEGKSKCILHCEKSEYSVDFHKIGFLKAFYDELIKYISKQLSQYHSIDVALPYDDFVKYFTNGIDEVSELNREIFLDNIKSHAIVLNHIVFPSRKSIDSFDYEKVLQKLDRIHFNYCEFQVSWLELEESQLFFQDCIFHDSWMLNNFKVLKNVDDVLYQSCTFENQVSSSSEDDKLELESIQFKDCKFTKIHFEDTIFKKQIFKNWEGFRSSLESLELYDCVIEDKFIFNRHELDYLRVEDTVFKGKFEFKDNRDVETVIMNTNFEGLVDFYKTNFKDFFAQKSIFNEFTGFEMCTFGSSDFMKVIEFEHVTFLSFINFRDTKFYAGLDMRDINLKEYPNFLDAYVAPKNTNKETFRIIKHSFDKVGNATVANKYFSLEMAKERRETRFWENPEKKFVLWFNFIISNFGQSFMLPLFWIFTLGVINHFVYDWLDNTTIYSIFSNYNVNYENIKNLINNVNGFANNILPFKRFLPAGKEFVGLLFLIGYSTLIYHFIVAVKRRTKR